MTTEETTLRKRRRIADFSNGEEVEDLFIIEELSKRERRGGDPFYIVTLRDSSGSIEGRVWDHVDLFERRGYEKDDYVRATLEIGEYKGKRVCSIRSMRPVSDDQVDPADFIPVSPRAVDEMIVEFRALIAAIKDPELNGIINHIFHPEGRLWHDFIEAPSARSVHQAYLHGLLEHTINVANNARALGACYSKLVDLDILTSGALIHDMGKTIEYAWKPRIDYTDMGLMMGHIPIGSNMLHDFARGRQMAPGKLARLHHMILSHHGRAEWGSPRPPSTPEAFILHYADYADAQLAVYEEEARHARERHESWSGWNKFIERRVFAGGGDFARERLPGEYADDLARLMAAVTENPLPKPQD
jgi:3'-5' exoribonuclease